MTTQTRKKYTFTKEHIENIRQAARKSRKNGEQVEMCFPGSPNDVTLDEQKRQEKDFHKLLTDYFTNLDALIFWRNLHGKKEVSVNIAFKSLEVRLGRNLADKFGDIVLLLTQHIKGMVEVDKQFAFPNVESLIIRNGKIKLEDTPYGRRYKSIYGLKSESIKNLKEILEGK